MHHTVAYTGSIAAGTSFVEVAALQDEIITIQNNHFLPQEEYDIQYIFASCTNYNRARFVSPSNRQITTPFIRPANSATLPASNPNIAVYSGSPFRIKGLEELSVELIHDDAAAQRATVLMGWSKNFTPIPMGDIFTLRGTSTTAATANAWSTLTTTWQDQLAAGTYAVIGAEVQSTNAIGFRLIFENQILRPGGVSITSLGNRTAPLFYKGGLGNWGNFKSTRMPIVQVLANAADASHSVYLDIVRIPGSM